MPQFYRRQIRTQVAGLTIEGLRQTLSIERHSDPTQNRGSLAVYNLSVEASNRMIPTVATGEIRERGIPITVDAGYPDTIAQVFEGEVQRAIRSREGTDVITRVTLGDMVRSVRRLGGVTNRSYPGVTPVRQIARDIIGDMELEPGPLTAIPDFAVAVDFRRTGSAGGGLESLLRNASPSLAHLHWFELDGVVRINAPGDGQPDAPTIPLSPETGLIESPVPTDEGAECRMFLNPSVVVGCLIDLQSSALAGLWKVIALRHTGDNWSGVFETAVDMRREGEGRVQVDPPDPLPPGVLGGSGEPSGFGPLPSGGGPRLPVPNMLSVVQSIASQNQALLDAAWDPVTQRWIEANHEFLDLCIEEFHRIDPRWGYNCVRGDCNRLSIDAAAYYHGTGDPSGSFNVSIIDFLAGVPGGGTPVPAWNDVTEETRRNRTVGRWRYPR